MNSSRSEIFAGWKAYGNEIPEFFKKDNVFSAIKRRGFNGKHLQKKMRVALQEIKCTNGTLTFSGTNHRIASHVVRLRNF